MFFAALVISIPFGAYKWIRCAVCKVSCYLKKTLLQGSMNCIVQSGNGGSPLNHQLSLMAAY